METIFCFLLSEEITANLCDFRSLFSVTFIKTIQILCVKKRYSKSQQLN